MGWPLAGQLSHATYPSETQDDELLVFLLVDLIGYNSCRMGPILSLTVPSNAQF
jgi:hypothetical protein